MNPGLPPRRAALRVLAAVRTGTPLDAALDRELGPQLPDADRRLVHELAAGVLRHRTELDRALAPLARNGWDSVEPVLQDLLRLGAYQLRHLDRIPAHAAVDTSVTLAREVAPKATGFVNAVLRKVGSRPAPPPPEQPMLPLGHDGAAELAARHSHPEWMVARWLERFGAEGTERLLAWNNSRPPLVLQPARASAISLARAWRRAGHDVRPAPFGAGILTEVRKPAELPRFEEGGFIVQDPAQALVAWYADLEPGSLVYDACAAPGGKTIGIGRAGLRVIAGDADRRRVARLTENLARAGTSPTWTIVADAAHPPLRAVDAVLIDAPCLGTGTFARHPDARWRATPEALARLAELQRGLLDAAAGVVRPGGVLVYATCSLEPEENAAQVEAFLARHPDFRREPTADLPPRLLSVAGDLETLPQRDGLDGAFAARLRRAA